jgi:hypothetical protein
MTFTYFKFSRILDYFKGHSPSEEERNFSVEWAKNGAEVYGRAALYMMFLFQCGSLCMDLIDLLRGTSIGRSWMISLLTLGLIIFWSFRRTKSKHNLIYIYVAVSALTLTSISYKINLFHAEHFLSGRLPIAAHIGYSVMGATCISMMPTIRKFPPLFLMALAFGILHAAWLPYSDAWPALRLTITFFIAGLIFHYILELNSFREASREFESRHLLASFEKASLEQDLLLARRIQDSLSNHNNLDFSPYSTGILQRRFSQIGGDWAALRQDKNGTLYALVADAAGKGIQAALVLHSVQSLWAESLGEPNFDPEKWLRRVNSALCQLGAKKPHMLTMGIAKFSHIGCSYYSAGHLPLFLVRNPGNPLVDDVKILLAPGTPVGLISDFTVGHTHLDLSGDFTAFLGSDGFFRSGSHQKRKAILQLVQRLRVGESLVPPEDPSNVDDQTLIWISRSSLVRLG